MRMQNCAITHEHAYNITQPPVWFSDEVITTGFSILSRKLECKAYGIALLSPWIASAIFKYQMQADGEAPGTDIVKICTESEFLFVPISDGYASSYLSGINGGTNSAGPIGLHWSLLVIDCRDLPLRATYLDSFPGHAFGDNPDVAQAIVYGVRKVQRCFERSWLKKVEDEVTLFAEPNAPDQFKHNSCVKDRGGSCGPFIWAMTKAFARRIIKSKSEGVEVKLRLNKQFAEKWGWNSLETRRTIKAMIQCELRVRMLFNDGNVEWFNDKGKVVWKSRMAELGLDEDWYWEPKL
jgi:hypothetical protein